MLVLWFFIPVAMAAWILARIVTKIIVGTRIQMV